MRVPVRPVGRTRSSTLILFSAAIHTFKPAKNPAAAPFACMVFGVFYRVAVRDNAPLVRFHAELLNVFFGHLTFSISDRRNARHSADVIGTMSGTSREKYLDLTHSHRRYDANLADSGIHLLLLGRHHRPTIR